MRAVQLSRFGNAAALHAVEVAQPVPGGGDLLVRVAASGVNPVEWKIRSGAMAQALGRDLPVTFGWACAGVVEQTGPGVTGFQAGDEVYAYPAFSRGGTHADYVLIDASQAALKPAALSFAEAAAVPMTAQAAWVALERGAVRPDERVLVQGGGGAVGHWLIQLARSRGARVTATASGSDIDRILSLGAEAAIDHRSSRFEEAGPFDVVLDLVGGATQGRSWDVLGRGGRLVSTASPPDAARGAAIGASGIFVFTPPDGQVLHAIAGIIDAGMLRPLAIARALPLSDAGRAHQLGESGQAGGKMVLLPDMA